MTIDQKSSQMININRTYKFVGSERILPKYEHRTWKTWIFFWELKIRFLKLGSICSDEIQQENLPRKQKIRRKQLPWTVARTLCRLFTFTNGSHELLNITCVWFKPAVLWGIKIKAHERDPVGGNVWAEIRFHIVP